jgi:metallo-beta-lactamase superfamily protein
MPAGLSPPCHNEVEISILGPGFGECILIHAGFNDWIVIDSCIDSVSGRAAPLVYLESLGVEPGTAVRLVLCTHWHDDHVGGISEVLLTCNSAEFACSSALTRWEFLEVVQIFNKRPLLAQSSGLTEIQKVFSILRSRNQTPKYAIADRLLLSLSSVPPSSSARCELTALSPSDAEYQRFLHGMSKLLPEAGATKFRLPSLDPNDISVATWLKIGSLELLLGADLEEHRVAGRGWSAVLASTTKPAGRASVFKVAHHGSVTGHHPQVWADMLDDAVIAVVTPWNLGSRLLPHHADCDRMLGLTSCAYSSSGPIAHRVRSMPSAVVRTLREGNITIRDAEPPTGCVRLRAPIQVTAPAWSISLFQGSVKLKDYKSALA